MDVEDANRPRDRPTAVMEEQQGRVSSTPASPSSLSLATTATDANTMASHTYPPTGTSTAPTERELAPLPQPDRGRSAYLFLFGAFVVETVIWGLPSAYGVFLDYYQQHGVAGGNKGGSELLPLVGSFSGGLMYLMGTPIALLLNPRPQWRVPAARIGCVICCLSLLAGSYAKTPWQLLLTQGVAYSLGGSLAYYPSFSFLSEWFVERRGLANGIVFAAGGVAYPFLLDALLAKYGPAVTLRALAVATAIFLAAAMPLLGPRIPVGKSRSAADRARAVDRVERRKVFRSKRLWVFLLGNIAQAFGYFLPMLFLPTFATSLGLSGADGSALLACVNGTAVVSRITMGFLSDRMAPHKLGAITMTASTAAVIILWGVTSTSLVPLLVFSLVLGLAAGGWTSLYSTIIKQVAKDDPQLSSTLFGLMSLTRGVGSLLTAPVSSFLITRPLHSSNTGYGVADGKYGSLIIFGGLALATAAGAEFASLL